MLCFAHDQSINALGLPYLHRNSRKKNIKLDQTSVIPQSLRLNTKGSLTYSPSSPKLVNLYPDWSYQTARGVCEWEDHTSREC